MKYPHILSKVLRDFWCLSEPTHEAIIHAIDSRLAGHASPAVYAESSSRGEPPGYWEFQDIAIIPIAGILGKHLSQFEMDCGGASMDAIAGMIDAADASARIRRIIFDVNSPGGTVTGTPELGRKILDVGTRKQTVAFTDCDCCSGALWLASQCNHFYATGSSEIGSVGVRMVLLDYTKWLEEEGIKVNAIASGKYKLTGANFKPLEPDEREILQAESDRIHAQFKSAVTLKRSVPEEHLQGQVYRGEIAVAHGFIDGLVEDLDQAIALTLQLK